MSIIPTLDREACDMIRELCGACALGIDRIAQEKNLPRHLLAKLFVHTFETIADKVEEEKDDKT